MKEKSFIITDEMGLHARPASIIVEEANKFNSNIELVSKDEIVSLKSIMMVMSLGIAKGESFTIKAIGEDEDEAINSLNKVIVEQNLAE